MYRRPRNPTKDRLVNPRLLQFSYLHIGSMQTLAGFLTYFTLYGENGFLANQLFGLREDWDNRDNDEVTDSYGQQWVGALCVCVCVCVCDCALCACVIVCVYVCVQSLHDKRA